MADFRVGKGTVPGAYSEDGQTTRVRLLEVTVTAEKPNLWKWHVFERDVEVMHGHGHRAECIDHIVVFGERHLRHVLLSYKDYYNSTRTHWSLNKDAPVTLAAPSGPGILSAARSSAVSIINMPGFDLR